MCVGLTRRIFMRKYWNVIAVFVGFFILAVFSSCATASMADDSTLLGRIFSVESDKWQIRLYSSLLNETVTISSKDTDSGFTSWKCQDSIYGGKTLAEFGYFSINGTTFGFVLYNGGNEGEATSYKRTGLNLRWDWGENGQYSFVLKPDNTGLYYDFTGVPAGESTEPKSIYKAYKR